VSLSALRGDGPVRECLRTADSLGAPVGPLLLGAAETARARTQAELEREAERLAVRVLVPLGVCVLPAFVLLGVVPVLIAVLGGTGF
jgi:tight adherence protein B